MTPARRWTISAFRQSDYERSGVGKVVGGDEFRKYGEGVHVREDKITDADEEAVRAWLLVKRLPPLDGVEIRDMLSLILGEKARR